MMKQKRRLNLSFKNAIDQIAERIDEIAECIDGKLPDLNNGYAASVCVVYIPTNNY